MARQKKSCQKNVDYREYMRIQKAVSRHFIYYTTQIMEPHERLTVGEIAKRLTKYLCPTEQARITAKTVRTYLHKAQVEAEDMPPFFETYQFNPAYLAGEHWELSPPRPGPIRKKYKDQINDSPL